MDDFPAHPHTDGVEPHQGPHPHHIVLTDASANEEEEGKRRKAERLGKFCKALRKAPPWIEAGCAILLVIITGFYTRYAGKQVDAMNSQLQQMKSSSEQAKTDNLAAIQAQQSIATNALAASQDNFRKSFAASVEQFHLDQRAWVAVDHIDASPEVGKMWTINVIAKNTGKTFAEDFRGTTNSEPLIPGVTPHFIEKGKTHTVTRGLVPPNGIVVNVISPKAELKQSELDMFTSGKLAEFVYGKLWYTDIFGCSHWTRYCYEFIKVETSSSPQWILCSQYNEADKNTCH